MPVELTTCQHCGNQQRTIQPWQCIPMCKACNKPVLKTVEMWEQLKLEDTKPT